ncbi:helix-turn-helix domain-containing protein [Gracilibacillus dipsosauri]|uniref:helix-turn-helix domain-containing protein n=1 Tax=Gracilibacillus dipsosauri TaxID=178340 RepID=UPI002409A646
MKENYLKDNFASRLKKLREQRRLTLEQLADQINQKYHSSFTKSMISKWENGHNIELSSLKILSLYFGVSLNNLLGFNEKYDVIQKIPNEYYKIPIVRSVLGRKQIFSEDNIIGYISEPPLLNLNKNEIENFFYLKIDSGKYGKEIHGDRLILIKKDIKEYYGHNKIIVFDTGKEVRLEKIDNNNNSLTLESLTHDEDDQAFTVDLKKARMKIIGTAVAMLRKY